MKTKSLGLADTYETPRSAVRIVAPFLGGLFFITAFAISCCVMLAATRAYVGGESEWSKARSLAVKHLLVYAASGDPAELDAFNLQLRVPLGDRIARVALMRDDPNLEEARKGFRQGGIHEADITAMMWMFILLQDTPLMHGAVLRWEEGDRLIDQLVAISVNIRHSIEVSGVPSGLKFEREISETEGRLLTAERRFSQSLGESSRLAVALCSAALALLGLAIAWGVSLFVVRSISSYNKSEEAVRAANRRWALAASADGLGMIEWSLEPDTVHLDARACALYGVEPQSEMGTTLRRAELRMLIDPQDQPEAREAVENSLMTGSDYRHSYRVQLANGEVRHIEVTGRFDGEPNTRGGKSTGTMFAIVRDVSREMELRALQAEKITAESAERLRAQLLSRVSHELRTPLHAVIGFSQLALQSLEKQVMPEHRHLAHVQTAAKHLLGMVEDLLDLSAMQASEDGIGHTSLDLAALVESSLNMVGHQAEESEIAVIHRRPATPVWVESSERRLRQVVVNLLTNGIKYNRPRGTLEISYVFGEGKVTVAFQDQGMGMTSEQIKEIFQPFRRLPGTGDKPGTGLGLVIARSAVEQAGGSITVVSEPGQGTTFKVSIKCRQP